MKKRIYVIANITCNHRLDISVLVSNCIVPSVSPHETSSLSRSICGAPMIFR